MQIVLIDWYIVIDREKEFKEYWKSKVTVHDRSKMVGEFLSEPSGHENYEWVTWDLREAEVKRFINVGLWADAGAFHEQIGQYFIPDKGKEDFEFKLRRRALLSPACWRMGDWRLPLHDSGGVI